ncbi:hypothetical protein CCR75_004201 [Bremia lactucae]|uniref:Uncharacterized protein n=1 Tax=Bremia lactucae TaxID=4779 RepID=A0A976FJT1_BRELC|nr:hypothetical protein CCR75_004201 [Bremia lactucae]
MQQRPENTPNTLYTRMEDLSQPFEVSRTSMTSRHEVVQPRSKWKWYPCCCSRRRTLKKIAWTTTDERSASRASISMRFKSHDQLAAARRLKHQIAYYSTMRVHMKRVQLCLEHEKRNKFYKELVVYLCFLVVVLTTLLTLPVHFPYEQNTVLSSAYFQKQLSNETGSQTFAEIGHENEMWQWMKGPLLDQFYDPVFRNIRPLGSIQIRTGRVRGTLCSQTNGRRDFIMVSNEMCYPEFSRNVEMKESYGNTRGVLGTLYHWTDGLSTLARSETFKPGLVSHEMDYGSGGYVIYLPRDNFTAATVIMTQVQNTLIQDDTRYMAATFAFYNARSNLFSHVQGLFEMSNTDYMEVTGRVFSFRISASYRNMGHFLQANALGIVLFFATVVLMYREVSVLQLYGLWKYVQSLWNVLDMLQLVLLFAFLAHWVLFVVKSENIRKDLHRVGSRNCSVPANEQDAARACFIDIAPLASLSGAVTNYAASLGLVSVAIVFKYLRLNSRLNLLWRTLRFAAKDLLAFVVIFFTIFFGFAVMGYLTFGTTVQNYHSLSVSLTSCFQMLLGAFDYEEIYVANPTMAGIFFFSFMITIYLVCVNMFIAIMSEYYSLAQSEKKTLEEHKRNLIARTPTSDTDSLSSLEVEYDVMKQVQKSINGLRIRVKMPPKKKDSQSCHQTEQLVLCGFQRVLLVDYDYLMAERKRLRRTFRAIVHIVVTCGNLLRRIDMDFSFSTDQDIVAERNRSLMCTIDSSTDIVTFPVTYLPISSSLANTVALLQRLKRGMLLEIDDESLTKDRITLQVLGDQDAYKWIFDVDNNDRENDGLQVQIQNDSCRITNILPFGLRQNHLKLGDASHIRACRVLYNGTALLDGNEVVNLPKLSWCRYFVEIVLWNFFKHLFSYYSMKTSLPRLVTDVEITQLVAKHVATRERDSSCRFDELVRTFRLFMAKKIHTRHLRHMNLDDRVYHEVIALLERFPSVISSVDKRESEGYKYVPHPLDTQHIKLPHSINLLAELLAQNTHEVWAVGRIQQGWRWGTARDNDLKLHPDLVPYEALTEQDKQYDRDTSMSALKVIIALGYVLEPPTYPSGYEDTFSFGQTVTQPGETYIPKPIPTDDVVLPRPLRSVVELLAENTHEVWAAMRMQQGWTYGPCRHDGKKEHNGLVPYLYLTQDEKQMDRNTALQTVKLILRFGFDLVHKDHQRTRGMRNNRFNTHGQKDDRHATYHVRETVTIASGTAQAKRAFLNRV